MELKGSRDCGNSPKNQRVQDLSVALAAGDEATLSQLVDEDAVWEIAGRRIVEGRKAIIAAAGAPEVEALTVNHAIAHGRAGAANGRLRLANGDGMAFCDILEFTNAKARSVRRITTLRVPL
ncbi:nuclear transport factor 2 family protein [Nitratireductor kimnyeongensis]|uniref:Nuclear transport factor 2 family protein n=1 Tax=Nitratireductor kimnyeongensis TaxID=430679 RepID=A0ABW0T2Q9_9HYPH|nr:nuclear transport factor 2 family protein [Nitratireductor kimnyeongensis]QZZ35325.1 nuclear transport factor 2 family protein [Nitratireductor kimnyeongensis]